MKKVVLIWIWTPCTFVKGRRRKKLISYKDSLIDRVSIDKKNFHFSDKAKTKFRSWNEDIKLGTWNPRNNEKRNTCYSENKRKLKIFARFISSFVFHHFWQRSYQNQLSFSGKDSTAGFFFVVRHLRKTKMGWNAH